MCHALVAPGYMSEWLHWPKRSKKPSVSRITSRKNPRSSAWVTSCLRTTPSILIDPKSSLPVDTVGAHEVLDLVVGLHRLTGVAPEAFDYVVLDAAVVEVPVVDVRDLELSTTGRLQLGQNLPHGIVVEIDTGDGEFAGRIFRLLDDAFDAIGAVEVGHTEVAQVVTIGLMREHDPSPVLLLRERLNAKPKGPLEDVVAEHDHRSIAPNEPLCQAERFGDASRLLLVRIEETVDAEVLTVAEQEQELAGVRASGDQHHL